MYMQNLQNFVQLKCTIIFIYKKWFHEFRTVQGSGILVYIRNPCMSLISSLRACKHAVMIKYRVNIRHLQLIFLTSLIIRCCLIVFNPLNSGAITFISNIAPHPPKSYFVKRNMRSKQFVLFAQRSVISLPDTSLTSISLALGNLFLKIDVIFCSACLPASTPLGPFHTLDRSCKTFILFIFRILDGYHSSIQF